MKNLLKNTGIIAFLIFIGVIFYIQFVQLFHAWLA